MAINPNARYPGQTTAPSADYPYGGARNQTVLGDNTGTPLEADLINDILGFHQALLTYAGIAPSGDPETAQNSQYLQIIQATTVGMANGFASIGGELFYLDDMVVTPKLRTLFIPATSMKPFGADNWTPTFTFPLTFAWSRDASAANSDDRLVFSLAPHLQPGAEITEIRASVSPGESRATASDRMALSLSSNLGVQTETDNGSSGAQTIVMTPASQLIVGPPGSSNYDVMIRGGNGGSDDAVNWVAVDYLMPGPRNF